jgi:hypothetical protein
MLFIANASAQLIHFVGYDSAPDLVFFRILLNEVTPDEAPLFAYS